MPPDDFTAQPQPEDTWPGTVLKSNLPALPPACKRATSLYSGEPKIFLKASLRNPKILSRSGLG